MQAFPALALSASNVSAWVFSFKFQLGKRRSLNLIWRVCHSMLFSQATYLELPYLCSWLLLVYGMMSQQHRFGRWAMGRVIGRTHRKPQRSQLDSADFSDVNCGHMGLNRRVCELVTHISCSNPSSAIHQLCHHFGLSFLSGM